jgi:hypothetical protein
MSPSNSSLQGQQWLEVQKDMKVNVGALGVPALTQMFEHMRKQILPERCCDGGVALTAVLVTRVKYWK